MVRFADETMREQIKKLWHDCFGDSNEYVEFFLSKYDISRHMLVFIDGEYPVSMLSLLPMSVVSPAGMQFSGRYIYAVATDPRYRGRGISTKLLEAAHHELRKMGVALSVLAPANGQLFNFYHKRGFESEFFIGSAVVDARSLEQFQQSFAITEATMEEFINVRERAFAGKSIFVRWDPDSLSYRMAETSMLGGETLSICANGARAIAVCFGDGDTVTIKEFAADGMELFDALAILQQKYHAMEYHLRLPMDKNAPIALERTPLAMTYWYNKELQQMMRDMENREPYMNLVLD